MIENLDQNQIIFFVIVMAIAAIPVGFVAGLFGVGGGLITVPVLFYICLLYTSPSPRDRQKSRMPSSA